MQIARWLLVLPMIASACSNSSLPNKPKIGEKSGSEDSAKSGDPAPAPSPAPTDSEQGKTTAPVQVSGAFLTVACDVGTSADATPPSSDQDTYGCQMQDSEHARFKGTVNSMAVTVNFAADPAVTPDLHTPNSGSKWDRVFFLAKTQHDKIVSFGAKGSATGSNGVATPFDLTQFQERVVGMKAVVGDVVAAMDSTFNGQPAQGVFKNVKFQAGDKIRLVPGTTSGSTLVRAYQLGDKPAVCPDRWRLDFLDANNHVLVDAQGSDVSTYANGRAVPTGAVSAWLGFHDATPADYGDNEGSANFTSIPGIGGGCNFTFELDR